MRDVAIISFAQGKNERQHRRPERGRDAHAGHRRGARRGRHDDPRHRLHLLGQHRLPGRCRLQLRDDARRRRAVAAHPGEPRRDGRRLGGLRGLGEDPARRDRLGPRLLLRQVVARRPADGDDPPARPVLGRAAVARLGEPGRAAGPGAARLRQGHGRADGRGGRPQPQGGDRQPLRAGHRRHAAPSSCSPEPETIAPLRKHDCPPITDGVAAVVLAADDVGP